MATNNARDNLMKQEYFDRFDFADGLRISRKTTHSSRARWPINPYNKHKGEKL